MTHCFSCGRLIEGDAVPTFRETSRTERDGKTEITKGRVLICYGCADDEARQEAHQEARRAAMIDRGGVALLIVLFFGFLLLWRYFIRPD